MHTQPKLPLHTETIMLEANLIPIPTIIYGGWGTAKHVVQGQRLKSPLGVSM